MDAHVSIHGNANLKTVLRMESAKV